MSGVVTLRFFFCKLLEANINVYWSVIRGQVYRRTKLTLPVVVVLALCYVVCVVLANRSVRTAFVLSDISLILLFSDGFQPYRS